MSNNGSIAASPGYAARAGEFAPVGGQSKRMFDWTASIIAITLLAVLFATLTVVLLVVQGRPIFISHVRVGRNGKLFKCLKFRTMVRNPDEVLLEVLQRDPAAAAEWGQTRKLRLDPRVTSLGYVLRKTSVDELPQLVNILRGEMSFVGPRPIVPSEVEKYGDRIGYYYQARPGLTGAWQTSGRNDVSYETRVGLDADYVRRWSFGRDVVLMVKTVPAVLGARGVY